MELPGVLNEVPICDSSAPMVNEAFDLFQLFTDCIPHH